MEKAKLVNHRFRGKYDTTKLLTIRNLLRWRLCYKTEKNTPYKEMNIVYEPVKLQSEESYITWLGHASFYLQLNGKKILIDPVFFDIIFYKRNTAIPYSIEELQHIDYVLISHSHFDHLDKPTLQKIISSESTRAIVPKQMGKTIKSMNSKFMINELCWEEKCVFDDISFTFLPSRHYSRRGLFDENKILWGSYIIQYRDITIYFAGDTSYGDHFKEIGEMFDIDIALLPIGTYEPDFVMKHNHLSPEEAVRAFHDLDAKRMFPMHYGTFSLSDEPLSDPWFQIEQIKAQTKLPIDIISIGKVNYLNKSKE